MECKAVKFQQSPVSTSPENGDQQLIYKFRTPYVCVCCLCAVCVCAFVMCICVCVCLTVTVINNESSKGLTDNTSSNKNDVALNMYPDGSRLSISIDGKTADITKISFDTTMEGFSIIISCRDRDLSTELLPARAVRSSVTILVISVSMSNPLHIVLGDTPYVTASITLGIVTNL